VGRFWTGITLWNPGLEWAVGSKSQAGAEKSAFGQKRKETMKKIGLLGLGVLAAWMLGSGGVHAVETKAGEKEKPADKQAVPAARAIPFQGSVVAVDPVGRTFTLNGKAKERLFKVNDQTEIMADNKQAHFNSIAVGSVVRGQALKHEDGWEAKKVMVGPKEATPASNAKKQP